MQCNYLNMALSSFPRLLLTAILLYSSFSRFTTGTYTLTYYAYQTAHHVGDDVIIACGNALLATLITVRTTRVWAAGLATALLVVSIAQELQERGVQGVVWDTLLCGLGAVVLGIEMFKRW
ncbi:hypothetical protein BKA65DRAFT_543742 [Rhexocercosporidium sp. MPI-PUGE-AT-0058]|nr:hypothetical protein BKA65DRAFT_543742 [Rhexocercosporidium sp. MPI-PUGE-AT-0058]